VQALQEHDTVINVIDAVVAGCLSPTYVTILTLVVVCETVWALVAVSKIFEVLDGMGRDLTP